MVKKPVRLSNGKQWATRGDAIDHFRDLRDRHPIGVPISDPSDHEDLLSLLERYDLAITDGPSKIGSGVDHFETRVNITNGGRTVGLWVVRQDGSETDFSFIRAVNAAPKREIEQLADACRGAVFSEILSAKNLYFAIHADAEGYVTCPITGDKVTLCDCRLEYVGLRFGQIVNSYAEAQGWQTAVPQGVISPAADAQTTTVFVSLEHAEGFRRLHRSAAKILVVSKDARLLGLEAASARPQASFLEL